MVFGPNGKMNYYLRDTFL